MWPSTILIVTSLFCARFLYAILSPLGVSPAAFRAFNAKPTYTPSGLRPHKEHDFNAYQRLGLPHICSKCKPPEALHLTLAYATLSSVVAAMQECRDLCGAQVTHAPQMQRLQIGLSRACAG